MARPNNAQAIAGHVQGLREAKAAFQALPDITRQALAIATRQTVEAIASHAKARILRSPSVQTRTLLNAVGFSMNEKSGRGKAGVGNVTTTVAAPAGRVGKSTIKIKGAIVHANGRTRLINPRRYAHLVEFGTRAMPAEPFMIPAAEANKQPYLDRLARAKRQIEDGVAALSHVGGRTL